MGNLLWKLLLVNWSNCTAMFAETLHQSLCQIYLKRLFMYGYEWSFNANWQDIEFIILFFFQLFSLDIDRQFLFRNTKGCASLAKIIQISFIPISKSFVKLILFSFSESDGSVVNFITVQKMGSWSINRIITKY